MSITTLFDSRNGIGKDKSSYSSTDFTELSSTTFKLGYQDYCIHCGQKASPIQANIDDFKDYDTTGYRCNCEAAMKEMATLVAFNMGNFPAKISPNDRQLKVSPAVIQGILARQTSVSIDLFTNNQNGKVISGQADTDFLSNHKDDIQYFMKDRYYDYRALSIFMKLVGEKFDEFVVKTEELHREQLTYCDKMRSDYLGTETTVKEES